MLNEISIADKLRKISMDAKIGAELPKIIEKACAEEAEKGKYTCRIYFCEPPTGLLPFYGSLGPANQTLWKEINKSFDRRSDITHLEFTEQVIRDLSDITGLKITLLPPPCPDPAGINLPMLNRENIADYQYSSVVIDACWDR